MEPPGSNPNDALSIETQAIGRALRIGQTRRLVVTRFLLRDTIEEKLFELIQATRLQAGPAASSDLLTSLTNTRVDDSANNSVDSSGGNLVISSSCSSGSSTADSSDVCIGGGVVGSPGKLLQVEAIRPLNKRRRAGEASMSTKRSRAPEQAENNHAGPNVPQGNVAPSPTRNNVAPTPTRNNAATTPTRTGNNRSQHLTSPRVAIDLTAATDTPSPPPPEVPWITPAMHCPVCQTSLTGLSNAQINRHIDRCL